MAPTPRQQKRKVDTACGYNFAAYGSASAFWLAVLLLPPAALLCLIMAAIAGFFGLLRTLTMPVRFSFLPAFTLCFVAVMVVVFFNDIDWSVFLVITFGGGLVYSTAGLVIVLRLWSRDFAKPMPAWLCHQCGYPLFGLTQPTCPECGGPFDPARVPEMPGGGPPARVG